MKTTLYSIILLAASMSIFTCKKTDGPGYTVGDIFMSQNKTDTGSKCTEFYVNKFTRNEDIKRAKEIFIGCGKKYDFSEDVDKYFRCTKCPEKNIILAVKLKHDGKTFIKDKILDFPELSYDAVVFFYKSKDFKKPEDAMKSLLGEFNNNDPGSEGFTLEIIR